MITTMNDLLAIFRNYATASAGIEFIFISPNAPRPDYPYGTINITSLEQKGYPNRAQSAIVGDDFVQVNDALFMGMVDFDVKSSSRGDELLDLINGVNLSIYDELNNSGIGFIRFGTIVDLTGLEVEKTIGRFRVTMYFDVVITAENTAPFIKSVEVNNIIIGE